MSRRTSSRSTFTMVPSTMSPSLKYLIVASMAARKSASEPMSLTATCGCSVVGSVRVGVLLVIGEWVPWGWTDVRVGARESRFHLQRKDSVGRSGTGTSEREAAPSETRADLRCSGKDIRRSHDESNRCRRTLCACDVAVACRRAGYGGQLCSADQPRDGRYDGRWSRAQSAPLVRSATPIW